MSGRPRKPGAPAPVYVNYREMRGEGLPPRKPRQTFHVGDLVRLRGHPEVLTLVSLRAGVARVIGPGEVEHEEPACLVRGLSARERRDAAGKGQGTP